MILLVTSGLYPQPLPDFARNERTVYRHGAPPDSGKPADKEIIARIVRLGHFFHPYAFHRSRRLGMRPND